MARLPEYSDDEFAEVELLLLKTTMTYKQIAAKTGLKLHTVQNMAHRIFVRDGIAGQRFTKVSRAKFKGNRGK